VTVLADVSRDDDLEGRAEIHQLDGGRGGDRVQARAEPFGRQQRRQLGQHQVRPRTGAGTRDQRFEIGIRRRARAAPRDHEDADPRRDHEAGRSPHPIAHDRHDTKPESDTEPAKSASSPTTHCIRSTVVFMKVGGTPHPYEAVAQPVSRTFRAKAEAAAVDTDARTQFRAIYDAWFDDVSRWIRALGGMDADRDDIVQEVFLVVRRRLSAFDGGNLAGWLYRITSRQVRDFRRRAWVKHIFTRRRAQEPDVLPHAGGSPAMALERKEEQRVLQMLLAKMPEARRIAFVLFEIEGLSGDEIARIQDIPLNTVWTRLHHARREFFALAAKYQQAHGNLKMEGTR